MKYYLMKEYGKEKFAADELADVLVEDEEVIDEVLSMNGLEDEDDWEILDLIISAIENNADFRKEHGITKKTYANKGEYYCR